MNFETESSSAQSGFSLFTTGSTAPMVLLAEDDDGAREVMATFLQHEGYRVIEVEDGLELEDYLQFAADAGGSFAKPDIIVCEARMPGPGGLEVLATLREHDLTTRFILINSSGDAATELEAVRLGADFVFDKPLDVEELREALYTLAA